MSPEVAKVLRRTAQLQFMAFGRRPLASQWRPVYRALKRQWYALPSKARASYRRQLEYRLAQAGMPAPIGARLRAAMDNAHAAREPQP